MHGITALQISIVTPSFNQARFISKAIESVLGQIGDFRLEYLVVDGGSTDSTLAILEGYGSRLTWVSETDRGQVDAINKGLKRATGDIVGWLNSDDLLLPGALARVVEALQRNPEAEWVHGRCRIIDENDRRVWRWIEAYKHFRAKHYSFEALLMDNFVSQMTVFWRRRAMKEVGYLDSHYPLAFDYDYWLRLAQRGNPIYIEPPQACFRWYETSKSGVNRSPQLRENAEVVRRYCGKRRLLAARKRIWNAMIVSIYKTMSAADRAGKRLSPPPY